MAASIHVFHRRIGITATTTGIRQAVTGARQSLVDGFSAQAAGRPNEALQAFRQAGNARSPLLRALAGNAEALQLLRSPVGICGDDREAETPSKALASGDKVFAPWAEDGEHYAATIISVDEKAGECTIDWEDGGQTSRVVSMAAVISPDGRPCSRALSSTPSQVRLWSCRRAMRSALVAWQSQAESGAAHDAFVDVAGILCDNAFAEARVALFAPRDTGRADGLERARLHLQRARFLIERAYKPDARALAAICLHRAELLRLSGDVASCVSSTNKLGDVPGVQQSLTEALSLHERTAQHLAAATWKNSPQNMGTAAHWQLPGGHLAPEAVHQLLWAKALASQAVHMHTSSISKSRTRTPRPKSVAPRRNTGPPSHGPKKTRPTTTESSNYSWSLPEKLVPPVSGLPQATDWILQENCPARAAAFRGWKALYIAARKRFPDEPIKTLPWNLSSDDVTELVSRIDNSECAARLLLEVSVLIFAMGCRLGCPGKAGTVAAPLAQASVDRLSSVAKSSMLMPDDTLVAAEHASSFFKSANTDVQVPSMHSASLSGLSRQAALQLAKEGRLSHTHGSKQRWRLAAYSAIDELWRFRLGDRQDTILFATPPLSWGIEGLALSETAVELEQQTHGIDI